MNVEKMAAIATIAALPFGAYCAYGTWTILHQPAGPAPIIGEGTQSFSPSITGIAVSLFIAVGLIVTAAVLNLIARRNPSTQGTTTPTQMVASAAIRPAVPSPIDARAFFHDSYTGQVQKEVEQNIRAMIEGQPQGEREEFCVRFIATGLINVIYDKIWTLIFRSQLLALEELNQKNTILRREEIKPFYDAAVLTNSIFYANYSFEEWYAFMKGQGLVLDRPGDTVEITVRGKDFLKFMVHFGYTTNSKKN
jgi:hypothetical protein